MTRIFPVLAESPENDYIKFFEPDYSLKIPGGHIVREVFHWLLVPEIGCCLMGIFPIVI